MRRRGSLWRGRARLSAEEPFYIGEVVYRGEVYRAEHEPILESTLFEAVQSKLAVHAVARRCRLRGSPALLTGRLFDVCGNRLSPTHTNKAGARYRYYVSQAALQGKPQPAGSVGRVPASEIEGLVITALRKHLTPGGGEQLPDNDLELLERYLDRVTLMPNHLELRLRQSVEPAPADNLANKENPAIKDPSAPFMANVTTITVPWMSPLPARVKNILHVPAHNTPIKPSRRDALLMAIAKARSWVDELANGRHSSFAELAKREAKAERHIRLLVLLAFVSPRIVSKILDGTAPAGLTITTLARALPWSWAEQERRLGLPCDATCPSAKSGPAFLERRAHALTHASS